MVLSFWFFWFKNQKPRMVEFLVFMIFFDIIFLYKFCAQSIWLLFLYYNFIFNLHEFTLALVSAA